MAGNVQCQTTEFWEGKVQVNKLLEIYKLLNLSAYSKVGQYEYLTGTEYKSK